MGGEHAEMPRNASRRWEALVGRSQRQETARDKWETRQTGRGRTANPGTVVPPCVSTSQKTGLRWEKRKACM